MAYNDRHEDSIVRGSGLAVSIVLVIVVGLFLAWWWEPRVGVDLSPVSNAVSRWTYNPNPVGVVEAPREAAPQPSPAEVAAAIEQRLQSSILPQGAAPVGAGAGVGAPYCPPGQPAQFVLGFAELKRALGNVMGQPLECEHVSPQNGDTLQQTTTGLAVYQPSTGTAFFTDGWRKWALTPQGVVTWEGPSNTPPTAQQDVAPAAGVNQGDRLRVANTDGLGVVLRATPRMDDRTAAAIRDGAQVTLIERRGADWARVQGPNAQVGWVPTRYLAPMG